MLATLPAMSEWLSMHGVDFMQVLCFGLKPKTYTNMYHSRILKSCSVLRVALSFLSLPYYVHKNLSICIVTFWEKVLGFPSALKCWATVL